MTPQQAVTGALGDSAFMAIRGGVGLVVFVIWALISWRVIIVFAGERSKELGLRKIWLTGGTLVALTVLFLARGPVEIFLRGFAASLEPKIWTPEPVLLGTFLVGLYYMVISTLVFVLVTITVSTLFWFIEGRLAGWQERALALGKARGKDPVVHVQKLLRSLNRKLRVVVFLILMSVLRLR